MAAIADLFSLGLQHHQAGNLQQAESLYRQVLEAAPQHADAFHFLGVIAYQVGQSGQAVELIRRALELNPHAAIYHSNLGLAYDAMGFMQEAEAAYRRALELQPDMAEARANLGNACLKQSRFDEAELHYRSALQINPTHPQSHCGLGLAFAERARWSEAEEHYRQALRLAPNYAEAHNNIANVLLAQNRVGEARDHCLEALRIRPEFAEARTCLGNVCLHLDKVQEAEDHIREALRSRPTYAAGLTSLGNVLFAQGKLDEAAVAYQQSLQLQPQSADTYLGLGNTHLHQKKLHDATACYQQALQINPHSAEAHNGLGMVFASQEKFDDAITCYRQAHRLRPSLAQVCNNLGDALIQKDDTEAGMAYYQEALRLKPDYAEVYYNLGNAVERQGEFAKAIEYYQQCLDLMARQGYISGLHRSAARQDAIFEPKLTGGVQVSRLKPTQALANWNIGLMRLLQGQFIEGWRGYEWRWSIDRRQFAQPRWDGSPLDGRTILLYAEQGLGDTIQFIRFLPEVKKRGGKTIIECQAALMPLLAGAAGVDRLIAHGAPVPHFDVEAPLLSLGAIFQTTLETIPAEIPYLHADERLVDKWRKELATIKGFKVGIAWQGSPTFPRDRQRSMPLANFGPLANVPGVSLISLQKGHGTEQIRDLSASVPVLDLGSRLDEAAGAFMDTAAVMKCLDLVISSDTAIPHLAGALGVPVWLAVPAIPDWRWLLQRTDSPWYPSMQLFRQTRRGDWGSVFEEMATELRSMLAARDA